MSTGLSKFFIESSEEIPGWTWQHNRNLTLFLNRGEYWSSRAGYRQGVILVPIPIHILPGLKSRVVPVTPETEFVTVCKSRVAGEAPRKKAMALVDELPDAKYTMAVLYHRDVLAEDNDCTTECDWEVVALLCQVDDDEPITPATLMSNHFKADGGTATLMTPETFEAELRKAYNYWKNRAIGITREEWNKANGTEKDIY